MIRCIRLWTGDDDNSHYGIDLTQDGDACCKTRAETAAVLKVDNI
jgi:hypothetical protein